MQLQSTNKQSTLLKLITKDTLSQNLYNPTQTYLPQFYRSNRWQGIKHLLNLLRNFKFIKSNKKYNFTIAHFTYKRYTEKDINLPASDLLNLFNWLTNPSRLKNSGYGGKFAKHFLHTLQVTKKTKQKWHLKISPFIIKIDNPYAHKKNDTPVHTT